MSLDNAYRNLGAAITLQAVKDFFDPDETFGSPQSILNELRSSYLVQLSDGLSSTVAEELEKNPSEIAQRLNKHKEEFIC